MSFWEKELLLIKLHMSYCPELDSHKDKVRGKVKVVLELSNSATKYK